MDCPQCQSNNTRICKQKTALSYLQFRCRDCCKQFNERSGTTFNYIQYPTEVVMMVVHYYYRFRNSLDDVVTLMAMRGFYLSHQTVHNWTQTFGVELGLQLRQRRYGQAGKKWHVDSTYIYVEGCWCYFYQWNEPVHLLNGVIKCAKIVIDYLLTLRWRAQNEY